MQIIEPSFSSAIAVAHDNSVVIAGQTESDLFAKVGKNSGVVMKLNSSSGSILWGIQPNTTLSSTLSCVCIGNDGDIVSGGYEYTTKNSAYTLNKFSIVDGAALWSYLWNPNDFFDDDTIASSIYIVPYAVCAGAADDLFLTGYTIGEPFGQASYGAADYFVAKHNAVNGDLNWVSQFGTSNNDLAFDIASTGDGDVVVVGTTYGSLYGQSGGGIDIFIVKIDKNQGIVLLGFQMGTAYDDEARSVSIDASGYLFVAGSTRGDLFGSTAGSYQIFICKLTESSSSFTIIWVILCFSRIFYILIYSH